MRSRPIVRWCAGHDVVIRHGSDIPVRLAPSGFVQSDDSCCGKRCRACGMLTRQQPGAAAPTPAHAPTWTCAPGSISDAARERSCLASPPTGPNVQDCGHLPCRLWLSRHGRRSKAIAALAPIGGRPGRLTMHDRRPGAAHDGPGQPGFHSVAQGLLGAWIREEGLDLDPLPATRRRAAGLALLDLLAVAGCIRGSSESATAGDDARSEVVQYMPMPPHGWSSRGARSWTVSRPGLRRCGQAPERLRLTAMTWEQGPRRQATAVLHVDPWVAARPSPVADVTPRQSTACDRRCARGDYLNIGGPEPTCTCLASRVTLVDRAEVLGSMSASPVACRPGPWSHVHAGGRKACMPWSQVRVVSREPFHVLAPHACRRSRAVHALAPRVRRTGPSTCRIGSPILHGGRAYVRPGGWSAAA